MVSCVGAAARFDSFPFSPLGIYSRLGGNNGTVPSVSEEKAELRPSVRERAPPSLQYEKASRGPMLGLGIPSLLEVLRGHARGADADGAARGHDAKLDLTPT